MPKLKSYIIGFLASLALTLAAYFPVLKHVQSGHEAFSHAHLTLVVIILAVIQLAVQLVFFLHLLSGSRWNKIVFISTLGIVLIVVIGSIWIMNHLNYNMTPDRMNQYLMDSDGI